MNGGVETALVIGATSDIGRAIARTLVEEGCTLQLAATRRGWRETPNAEVVTSRWRSSRAARSSSRT